MTRAERQAALEDASALNYVHRRRACLTEAGTFLEHGCHFWEYLDPWLRKKWAHVTTSKVRRWRRRILEEAMAASLPLLTDEDIGLVVMYLEKRDRYRYLRAKRAVAKALMLKMKEGRSEGAP